MSTNNYNNIFSNSNTGASKNNATKTTKTKINSSQDSSMKNSKPESNFGKILILIIVILLVVYFLYLIVRQLQNRYYNSPIILGKTRQGDTTTLPIKAFKFKDPEDGQFGTEFTYTVWLYIKDTNFNQPTQSCSSGGAFKHIFHKGSSIDGIQLGAPQSYPLLQAPGLWLYPDINKLAINMNTFASPQEKCDIGNIPINKWFHLSIVLIGNSLDIYVNCNLKKRCRLTGVPKLNYGDFFITSWGGFQGFISNIRYFNTAINTFQIENQCTVKPSPPEFISPDDTPPYLADNWWMNTGFPRSTTR